MTITETKIILSFLLALVLIRFQLGILPAIWMFVFALRGWEKEAVG